MAKVKVRYGEDIDSALRRFKRMVQKDGILDSVREHEVYQSPSLKRREKHKKVLRKAQRKSFDR